MPLRNDEQYVVDCLLDFLGGDSATSRVGEDPPDAYLEFNQTEVCLEISQLSPISFDAHGNPTNRATEDNFGINICDSLDAKYGGLLPTDRSLCLVLNVPVTNARKYRRELDKAIASIAESCPPIKTRHQLSIINETVEVVITSSRPHSGKKIVGIISNKNSNANILINARRILYNRIEEKHAKCKGLAGDQKWLGLLNQYWLADHQTYMQAIADYKEVHAFDRILTVSLHGDVNDIYKA